MTSTFFLQLLEIGWINLLLSGDNAVVIALACRALPPAQRRLGVLLGGVAAVALRIVFTIAVVSLLNIPFLKLVGGLLLLWIGVKLIIDETDEASVAESDTVWNAVRTIALADMVMSLDNVIAIAAAARGSIALIIFGLVLSVPLIIFGAIHHAAAQGTAFTYQGQLISGTNPATGNYDIKFTLYNIVNTYVGATNNLIIHSNTPVANGLFTTTLDFGPGVFTGSNYWLDIAVRTNGASGSRGAMQCPIARLPKRPGARRATCSSPST